MTPYCAGAKIAGTITSSFIRPNRVSTAGAAFEIFQNSTIGDLTINATFADGSSSTPVALVKFGPGNLNIGGGGANSIRGGITINGGSISAAASTTLSIGPITLNSGRLALSTPNTLFNGSVTFNTGTTNTIRVTAANSQVSCISNVTFNAGSTRLEFVYNNGVPMSTTVAPLSISNLTASSTVTVDIYSGGLALGAYPLLKYSNAAPNFAAFSLGFLPPRVSALLSNDTLNGSIDLLVTAVNQPISWASPSGTWDVGATPNWVDPTLAVTTYSQVGTPYGSLGDKVQFEDTVSGASPLTVTLNTAVGPGGFTVNAAKNYRITGSGSIDGLVGLSKSGSGTLTLETTNTFVGGVNLNGGTVTFSALENLGATNSALTFGGGTLQFAAGNTVDLSTRTVTFAAGGGTLNDGGNTLVFANPIGNGGAGGLTKAGAGTLTLNGTNRYFGNTFVSQGTLVLSANTYITNSPVISVSGVLDASATGLPVNAGGNAILAGTGTVNGPVTIGSGGTLSPFTNGLMGTLTLNGDLAINGGTYVYDVSTSALDTVVVTGNLTLTSGTVLVNAGTLNNGVYKLIQYSGALLSGAGSSANLLIQGFAQAGKVAVLNDATAGEIDLVVSSQGGAQIVWQGDGVNNFWDVETTADWTNSAGAAVQFIQGDKVTFNDSSANTTVNLQAAVQPGSVTVNATEDYTLSTSANGKLQGNTGLTKNGSGTLTVLTANLNSGPTVINSGTVQVGNGGTTGDLGSGPITNNSALVFMQTDPRTVSVLAGTGTVTQNGSSTLTVNTPTYTGATAVGSGATLQLGTNGTVIPATSTIAVDGTVVLDSSSSYTYSSGISGSGSLTKTGNGVLTLSPPSSYTGNTSVGGGTLKLGTATVLPTGPGAGNVSVDGGLTSGGALDINGFNVTINGLNGAANTVPGRIVNNNGAVTNILTIGNGDATGDANTVIADNDGAGGKIAVVKIGGGTQTLRGTSTYSGDTIVSAGNLSLRNNTGAGNGSIILSNGATLTLTANGGNGVFVGNNVVTPAGVTAIVTSSSLGNGFSSLFLSGDGASTNSIPGPVSCNQATTKQFEGFTGTVQVEAGGQLRFSSTSVRSNGGDFTTFVVLGLLNTRNPTLTGLGIQLGALMGNGTVAAGNSGAGTTLYVIGGKGIDAEFSGTIADQSAGPTTNCAVTKVGAGKQTLSGTLAYTGPTTVNQGTLALAGTAVLDACPTINLSDSATLDVSALADPTLYLGNSITQTVSGFGNLQGNLSEASNSIVTVGLGTLAVANHAFLDGVVNLSVNRTNTVTASQLAAGTFTIGADALLHVTNSGPNLVNGSSFKLFSAPVSGFAAVTLPQAPATWPLAYVWENRLAIDGTIRLASGGLESTPTNITSAVLGAALHLSWPTDHTGWTLYTNAADVSNTNLWFPLAGSDVTNQVVIPINPNGTNIFFQMRLRQP